MSGRDKGERRSSGLAWANVRARRVDLKPGFIATFARFEPPAVLTSEGYQDGLIRLRKRAETRDLLRDELIRKGLIRP